MSRTRLKNRKVGGSMPSLPISTLVTDTVTARAIAALLD